MSKSANTSYGQPESPQQDADHDAIQAGTLSFSDEAPPTPIRDFDGSEIDRWRLVQLAQGHTYDFGVVERMRQRAERKGLILHVQPVPSASGKVRHHLRLYRRKPKKIPRHQRRTVRKYGPQAERYAAEIKPTASSSEHQPATTPRPPAIATDSIGRATPAKPPQAVPGTSMTGVPELGASRQIPVTSASQKGVARHSPSGQYLSVADAFTFHQPMIERRARAHVHRFHEDYEGKVQDAQIRTWERLRRMYPDDRVPHEHARAMANRAFDFAVRDTNRSPAAWGNEDPDAIRSDVMNPTITRAEREAKVEKPRRAVQDPTKEAPPLYDVPELEETGPTIWEIREKLSPWSQRMVDAIMDQQDKPVFRSGGGERSKTKMINAKAIAEALGEPRHRLYSEHIPRLKQELIALGIAPQHFAAEVARYAARTQCSDSLFVELYCAIWHAVAGVDRYVVR